MVGGREGPCKERSDGQFMEVLGQPFMVSLTGQLVSGEVTSLGVYEELENLSGREHRVVGTGKILPRKAPVLCVHS